MRRVASSAKYALHRASTSGSCHRRNRWVGPQRFQPPPIADDAWVGTGARVGTGRPPRVGVPRDLPSAPPPFEPDTALEPCSAADRETMFRQIVKRRAYPVGCASRCRHGYPRAFVHAPMHAPAPPRSRADEVTPSCPEAAGVRAEHAIGWLTCPLLHASIDALEKRGGIDDLAAVVAADPSLRSALRDAHVSAADARRWLLSHTAWPEALRSDTKHAHARYVLFETGIAGVALRHVSDEGSERDGAFFSRASSASRENWKDGANGNGGGGGRGNGVKCLHAHVGDALVRGRAANAIGHVVLEKLERDGVETNGTVECWRACAEPPSRV